MHRYIYQLLFIICLVLSCKTNQELSKVPKSELVDAVSEFLNCLNERDESCLQQIFHSDYRGISPVVEPQRKNEFITSMLTNFEQNKLQAGAEIKSIETGIDMAYVTMNWQIQSLEEGQSELLVNAQRLDIWKRERSSKKWCILSTLIYKEERY